MTTLCTRKPTADFALSIKTPCRRCRHLPTTRQAATASASILAVKIEGLPNRGKPNRQISHIGVGAPIN
jgi:hypothetical protein